MKYTWTDYSYIYKELVEPWIDEQARRFTGCDDGFDEYYQYWVNDSETKLGENFWTKIIIDDGEPIGIIALGLWDGVFNISEFIVRPDKRGRHLGSDILKELLIHSKNIIGSEIKHATAVIYPNNVASKKAFENAGFVFQSSHPDGDAWNYRFYKSN